MKKLALLLIIGITGIAGAQNLDLDQLFESSRQDVNTYFSEYTRPFMGSMASGLSNGWNNTARPHKFPGFDATVTVNISVVPADQFFFNFNNSDFNTLQTTDDGAPVPTIMGPSNNTQLYVGDPGLGTFTAPAGLQADLPLQSIGVPVPMAQIGIGLPKGTDLKIRYVPTIAITGLSDFSYSLWGIGVLHDVKQWIPGMKLLPFDLSGFVGYTNISMEFSPDIQNATDELFEFGASALTVQALISKKLFFFTPYAGIGMNFLGASFNMLGTYDIGGATITDPITIEDYGLGAGPRATIGARIKLAIFTIHADYTLQEFNNLSVGVGLSIR